MPCHDARRSKKVRAWIREKAAALGLDDDDDGSVQTGVPGGKRPKGNACLVRTARGSLSPFFLFFPNNRVFRQTRELGGPTLVRLA